jgi:16S rRNA (uracil1498-N3)-methyltransferase
MKQFLLPAAAENAGGEDGAGRVVRLSGRDYHYLVRVRRLRPGDVFNAVEPGGAVVRVLVRSAEGGVLLGECLPPVPETGGNAAGVYAGPLPPLALFQALPKGAKMDLIVRQAAEGGVAVVAPFVSGRSTPRPEPDAAGRLERWRRIVREARQQSGSAVATAVDPLRNFGEALAFWEELRERYERPAALLLHPETGGPPLETGSFHGYLGNAPCLVAIAVGPEGGFSPAETERFIAEGFKPVSLGNTVLRAETAAVYAAAAIRIILEERESWVYKTPR